MTEQSKEMIQQELFDNLEELSKIFQEVSQKNEADADDWWNNISQEEREKAFYSVVKRIHQGDIELGGSYRYVLYDVFGFDPGMYTQGMDCGYMALHNMIFDAKDLEAMKQVTRFEVIDEDRKYVKYLDDDEHVVFSLQDDDKTLKVFIDNFRWKEEL